MLILSKFSGDDKRVVNQSAIGVWNQYKEIAQNYMNLFEIQWKENKTK